MRPGARANARRRGSLQKSKDCGTKLVVIVNNDRQAALKKGSSFMPAAERVKLVRSIECVDAAIESVDEDRTCCKTVRLLVPDAFTNGGDQNNDTIPEAPICRDIGCELVDGLGLKVQSSSWLLLRSQGKEIKVKTNPNE